MLSKESLDELARLHSRGELTPSNVIATARDPQSPLHAHFEWDDDVAARAYRLDQAGRLIIRARVRILPPDPESLKPVRVRARIEPPVPLRVPLPGAYKQPTERAVCGAEERRQVTAEAREHVDPIAAIALVKDALRELVALRRRYAHLVELGDVHAAIDAIAVRVIESERGSLQAAVRQARELVERDGVDTHTAATRASAASGVPLHVVLEAVRVRRSA